MTHRGAPKSGKIPFMANLSWARAWPAALSQGDKNKAAQKR